MNTRTWLLAIAAALGLTALTPMHDTVSAQSATGIVISEFRFRGPAGANDEFVELFNAGTAPVNVGGWLVRSSNNVQPPGFFTRATIPANTVINPGCYYLVANTASGGFSGGVAPNTTYNIGIADDGGVALTTSSPSVIIDQVGHGTVAAAFGEGQRLPMVNTNVDRGFERRPGGALGHLDTNNNFADFGEISPANPQNSNTCLTTQVYLPHEIQGAAAASPIATGTSVTVRGVVTARTSNGFFVQTELGQEDGDASTSEGLYVSASGASLAAAVVGHSIRVAGIVSEAAALTQLTGVTSVVDMGATSLPDPFALTSAELPEIGSLDQLERFEGMRVNAASLTAVSGTVGGAFYAVLTGQQRPFREPGIAAGTAAPPCAIGPCAIPAFDGNPELLHVDSDGLEGATGASLNSGAVIGNVTGPLTSVDGVFTLLPEAPLVVSGGTLTSIANAPLANEFTIASLGFGPAFPAQLAKASLMIRHTLAMPDIVAVQEPPDPSTLSALAVAIDADAVAAGQVPPSYVAESGFLLKQSGGRVTLVSAAHASADASAPVVLRATITAPAQVPQTVTVIANDFAVFDPAPSALAARQAQAESLAALIQARQTDDPSEAIIVVGRFNAHRFNDGYADIVGTIVGAPATPDQVTIEAPDLVSPDLMAASDSIDPSERYSSIASGSAQLFDHVLLTAAVAPQLSGVAYPRVNADFSEDLRADATVPNRLSDRDPVMAYFTFLPDVTAPTIHLPGPIVATATSAAGAQVFYTATATDQVTEHPFLRCSRPSGSTFRIGVTSNTCYSFDEAGNYTTATFLVYVTRN